MKCSYFSKVRDDVEKPSEHSSTSLYPSRPAAAGGAALFYCVHRPAALITRYTQCRLVIAGLPLTFHTSNTNPFIFL